MNKLMKFICWSMLVVFCAAEPLSAVMIVDHQVSATGNAPVNRYNKGDTDGSIPFSLTSPFSPASGRSGYGGSNPVFYGGAAGLAAYKAGPFYRSNENFWQYAANNSLEKTVIVCLWKKADFLNGMNAAAVGINAISSFSVKAEVRGVGTADVRFVVQVGGGFFVSEPFRLSKNLENARTFSNPGGAQWYAYDPESDLMKIGGAATPDLSDITAVGVCFEASTSGTAAVSVVFRSFQVAGADGVVLGVCEKPRVLAGS
jgi:hypothetical protein